jgi:hypothetical protein
MVKIITADVAESAMERAGNAEEKLMRKVVSAAKLVTGKKVQQLEKIDMDVELKVKDIHAKGKEKRATIRGKMFGAGAEEKQKLLNRLNALDFAIAESDIKAYYAGIAKVDALLKK